MERLEDRTLLAIDARFHSGILGITSDASDAIVVTVEGGNVRINGAAPSFGALSGNSVTKVNVTAGPLGSLIDLRGVTTVDFTSLTEVNVDGGAGDDVIYGSAFKDTVRAGGGADWVDGGAGNDDLSGEAGADELFGGAGDDTILGGAGADTIVGGPGSDYLSGGAGDDALVGSLDEDAIHGDLGADTLNGFAFNDPPFSVDDAYTVLEDGVLTVDAAAGVLANDHDPDGGGLTASIVSGPLGGTLTLQANGSFAYTPFEDFCGVDSFWYVAHDGTDNGDARPVWITVAPVNDAPVGVADAYSVRHDVAYYVSTSQGLLANDWDPDGDELPEILVANLTQFSVAIIGGQGTGQLPATIGPFAVAVGDLDGDGHLDAMVRSIVADFAAVLLGNGDGSFQQQESYFWGEEGGFGFALADVDDDGNLDYVASRYSGFVDVRLGDGEGGFGAKTSYLVAAGAMNVAAEDLDGDGHVDLIAAGEEDDGISILWGAGDGAFEALSAQTKVTLAAPTGATMMAVADVDLDGLADLIVGNGEAATVSVYFGQGSRSFRAPVAFDAGGTATFVVAEDLNADGYADVIVANGPEDRVSVLMNRLEIDPSGIAAQRLLEVESQLAIDHPLGITVGDLDGDRRPDLLATNVSLDTWQTAIGVVRVWDGRGDGTFSPPRDIDAGRSPILAVLGELNAPSLSAVLEDPPEHGSVVLGVDGSFVYTPEEGYAGSDSFTYRVTDGVASSPLVTVTLDVLVNHPPIANPDTYVVEFGEDLAVPAGEGVLANDEDTDGDAFDEILVANVAASTISVLFPVGRIEYPVASGPFIVEVGDVNADGLMDVVVLSVADGRTRVLLGNGDGTLDPQTPMAGNGDFVLALALEDVNDDETLDIVTVGFTLGVSVRLGNGNGTFEDADHYAIDAEETYAILARDLDGDGNVDLVTATIEDSKAKILWGLGDGTFSAAMGIDIPRGAGMAAIADVDQDGMLDLFISNQDDATVTVIRGLGNRTFASPVAFYAGGFARHIVASDLDGDDFPDLVVGNAQTVTVLRNESVGSGGAGGRALRAASSYAIESPWGVSLGDIDRDGKDDLLVASMAWGHWDRYGFLRIWSGNGDGTFREPRDYDAGQTPVSPVLGDLERQPFTARIVEEPEHGIVELAADGSFVYTPEQGYYGSVRFTYITHDGLADSAPATVTIQIVADPPSIIAALENDTAPGGGADSDGITNDATIMGSVDSALPVTAFEVRFVGTPEGLFVDAMSYLVDGEFRLTKGFLRTLVGGVLPAGDWTLEFRATSAAGTSRVSLDLEYTNPDPTIDAFGLANDSGASATDRVSIDDAIEGSIHAGPLFTDLVVEIDLDGNGQADDEATLAVDGSFTYEPGFIEPGRYQLRARVREDSQDAEAFTGAWSDLEILFVESGGPSVIDFGLLNVSGSGGSPITTRDPRLTGTLYDEDGPVAGGHVHIAFHYTTGSGEPVPVPMEVASDGFGRFTAAPIGLPLGRSITAEATALVWTGSAFAARNTKSITFELETLSNALVVSDLSLARDTGASPSDGITRDPTITGLVTGAPAGAFVRVEVAYTVGGATETVATATDADGRFEASAVISTGAVGVRARAGTWDYAKGAFFFGDWEDFSFELTTAADVLPSITDLELAVDTGDSAIDRVTARPEVVGRIENDDRLLAAKVEYDITGDESPEGMVLADAQGAFRIALSGLAAGAVVLRVRAREYRDGTSVAGEWTSFTFTYDPTEHAAPEVARVELANDDGGRPDDGITSDPTLSGALVDDDSSPSLFVEIDLNGDGQADDAAAVDAEGNFLYVPKGLVPGEHTLRVRGAEWDDVQRAFVTGQWQAVTFTLLGGYIPADIENLVLVQDTGTSATDGITSDPTIRGTLAGAGGSVRIDVDLDGDEIADDFFWLRGNGDFEYTPTGLVDGPATMGMRTVGRDGNFAPTIIGEWSTISFILEDSPAQPPLVSTLELLRDTGVSDTDGLTTDATLVGAATELSLDGPNLIEFDHDGDGGVDGLAMVDAAGGFRYLPAGLAPGSHTVRARAAAWDPLARRYLRGPWESILFELEAPPRNDPPQVSNLRLVDRDGQALPLLEAALPRIAGDATNDGPVHGLQIEWDLDGDGAVDGRTIADGAGAFLIVPQGMQTGPATISVRAAEWNPGTGEYLRGQWTRMSFDVLPPPADAPATIVDFGLVHDTGADPEDGETHDPTLTGTATGAAPLAGVRIEFSRDGQAVEGFTTTGADGTFRYRPISLSTGGYTYRARVARWNDDASTFEVGEWTTTSFVLVARPAATVEEFGLYIDDGVSSSDDASSDPRLTGIAMGDGPLVGAAIEIDLDDDGAADGFATSGANGVFIFQPTPLLAPSQTTWTLTVAARVRQWDQDQGSFAYGDWTEFTFTVERPSNAPVAITDFGLLNDTGAPSNPGVTTDPTLRGRAMNDGPVGNLRVEIDLNEDGVVDGFCMTGADGWFTYTPIALPPGAYEVAARAVEWNATTNTFQAGAWETFRFTLGAAPNDPPEIVDLSLLNDTGSSSSDGQTLDPTIVGAIANDGPAGLLTLEWRIESTALAGTAVADTAGNFRFRPEGLSAGTYTIKVRAVEHIVGSAQPQVGDWESLAFTLLAISTAPVVAELELRIDDGDDDEDGVSTDVTLVGHVTADGSAAGLRVEFALSASDAPIGIAMTDAYGRFTFKPVDLTPDQPTTIRARAVQWDAAAGVIVAGAWTSIEITLEQVANSAASIRDLRLLHDTGTDPDDLQTSDPTLTGKVANDGSLYQLRVEFSATQGGPIEGVAYTDYQGRFIFRPTGLDEGEVTYFARVAEWNHQAGRYLYSAWTTIEFELVDPLADPPESGDAFLPAMDGYTTAVAASLGAFDLAAGGNPSATILDAIASIGEFEFLSDSIPAFRPTVNGGSFPTAFSYTGSIVVSQTIATDYGSYTIDNTGLGTVSLATTGDASDGTFTLELSISLGIDFEETGTRSIDGRSADFTLSIEGVYHLTILVEGAFTGGQDPVLGAIELVESGNYTFEFFAEDDLQEGPPNGSSTLILEETGGRDFYFEERGSFENSNVRGSFSGRASGGGRRELTETASTSFEDDAGSSHADFQRTETLDYTSMSADEGYYERVGGAHRRSGTGRSSGASTLYYLLETNGSAASGSGDTSIDSVFSYTEEGTSNLSASDNFSYTTVGEITSSSGTFERLVHIVSVYRYEERGTVTVDANEEQSSADYTLEDYGDADVLTTDEGTFTTTDVLGTLTIDSTSSFGSKYTEVGRATVADEGADLVVTLTYDLVQESTGEDESQSTIDYHDRYTPTGEIVSSTAISGEYLVIAEQESGFRYTESGVRLREQPAEGRRSTVRYSFTQQGTTQSYLFDEGTTASDVSAGELTLLEHSTSDFRSTANETLTVDRTGLTGQSQSETTETGRVEIHSTDTFEYTATPAEVVGDGTYSIHIETEATFHRDESGSSTRTDDDGVTELEYTIEEDDSSLSTLDDNGQYQLLTGGESTREGILFETSEGDFLALATVTGTFEAALQPDGDHDRRTFHSKSRSEGDRYAQRTTQYWVDVDGEILSESDYLSRSYSENFFSQKETRDWRETSGDLVVAATRTTESQSKSEITIDDIGQTPRSAPGDRTAAGTLHLVVTDESRFHASEEGTRTLDAVDASFTGAYTRSEAGRSYQWIDDTSDYQIDQEGDLAAEGNYLLTLDEEFTRQYAEEGPLALGAAGVGGSSTTDGSYTFESKSFDRRTENEIGSYVLDALGDRRAEGTFLLTRHSDGEDHYTEEGTIEASSAAGGSEGTYELSDVARSTVHIVDEGSFEEDAEGRRSTEGALALLVGSGREFAYEEVGVTEAGDVYSLTQTGHETSSLLDEQTYVAPAAGDRTAAGTFERTGEAHVDFSYSQGPQDPALAVGDGSSILQSGFADTRLWTTAAYTETDGERSGAGEFDVKDTSRTTTVVHEESSSLASEGDVHTSSQTITDQTATAEEFAHDRGVFAFEEGRETTSSGTLTTIVTLGRSFSLDETSSRTLEGETTTTILGVSGGSNEFSREDRTYSRNAAGAEDAFTAFLSRAEGQLSFSQETDAPRDQIAASGSETWWEREQGSYTLGPSGQRIVHAAFENSSAQDSRFTYQGKVEDVLATGSTKSVVAAAGGYTDDGGGRRSESGTRETLYESHSYLKSSERRTGETTDGYQTTSGTTSLAMLARSDELYEEIAHYADTDTGRVASGSFYSLVTDDVQFTQIQKSSSIVDGIDSDTFTGSESTAVGAMKSLAERSGSFAENAAGRSETGHWKTETEDELKFSIKTITTMTTGWTEEVSFLQAEGSSQSLDAEKGRIGSRADWYRRENTEEVRFLIQNAEEKHSGVGDWGNEVLEARGRSQVAKVEEGDVDLETGAVDAVFSESSLDELRFRLVHETSAIESAIEHSGLLEVLGESRSERTASGSRLREPGEPVLDAGHSTTSASDRIDYKYTRKKITSGGAREEAFQYEGRESDESFEEASYSAIDGVRSFASGFSTQSGSSSMTFKMESKSQTSEWLTTMAFAGVSDAASSATHASFTFADGVYSVQSGAESLSASNRFEYSHGMNRLGLGGGAVQSETIGVFGKFEDELADSSSFTAGSRSGSRRYGYAQSDAVSFTRLESGPLGGAVLTFSTSGSASHSSSESYGDDSWEKSWSSSRGQSTADVAVVTLVGIATVVSTYTSESTTANGRTTPTGTAGSQYSSRTVVQSPGNPSTVTTSSSVELSTLPNLVLAPAGIPYVQNFGYQMFTPNAHRTPAHHLHAVAAKRRAANHLPSSAEARDLAEQRQQRAGTIVAEELRRMPTGDLNRPEGRAAYMAWRENLRRRLIKELGLNPRELENFHREIWPKLAAQINKGAKWQQHYIKNHDTIQKTIKFITKVGEVATSAPGVLKENLFSLLGGGVAAGEDLFRRLAAVEKRRQEAEVQPPTIAGRPPIGIIAPDEDPRNLSLAERIKRQNREFREIAGGPLRIDVGDLTDEEFAVAFSAIHPIFAAEVYFLSRDLETQNAAARNAAAPLVLGFGFAVLKKLFGKLFPSAANAASGTPSKFASLSNNALNRTINAEQHVLLRQLFKGQKPHGLTRETLEAAAELSRRALANPVTTEAQREVHRMRLQLIAVALDNL